MNRRDLLLCSLGVLASDLADASNVPVGESGGVPNRLRIGLLINLSGVGAMYGPTARNCAEMAVTEINGRGGIAGRQIELVVGDAGSEPEQVVRTALEMLHSGRVEAFVAMHNSAVRVALVKAFAGRVPYVYTTIYEGGECSRGTYLLGTTPSQQLRPAIPWLTWKLGIKRWYLVGNDYNWPRGTNAEAKQYIASSGGHVVGEQYLPFDTNDFGGVIKRIKASGADAALLTLVGTSSILFNKQFADADMPKSVMRFSTYLDEPTLVAIGPSSSSNLYSSAGYFANIKTTAARAFYDAYTKRFGAETVLNDSGQACYEGLRFLEVVGNKAGSFDVDKVEAISQWQITDGPRGQTVMHDRHTIRDIYLAKAEGITFNVVQTFEAVRTTPDCRM